MFDETRGSVVAIRETKPGLESSLKGEYDRCTKALNRLGLITLLPQTERLGVIGFDGKEYPRPELAQVQEALDKNRALVERKRQEGFTKLQLVPLASPIQVLIQRAREAVIRHTKEGNIFQAKQNPSDPDIPVQVNIEDPLYVWDEILTGDQTNNLVYFPESFTKSHQGLTKDKMVIDPTICAVPGWSIGLVKDASFLPRSGQGKTVGGRKQIENNQSPNQYLQILSQTPYQGETGWAPEDFLTNFLTTLETTNQVSHDWNDNSAAWLIGTYLPKEGIVPYAYWARYDRKLGLDGSDPDYQDDYYGLPSTVRLDL